jgi:hypothetical protein
MIPARIKKTVLLDIAQAAYLEAPHARFLGRRPSVNARPAALMKPAPA